MAHTTVLRRWTAFNLVGLAGFAVQLAVVSALVHLAHANPLVATAAGVEAAVLQNFVWHQRWTWRDRRTSSLRERTERLMRFHALNGGVSLAGNLIVTGVLSGVFHVEPVIANVAGIVICGLVNFAASDRLVFRASVPVIAVMALAPRAAYAGPGVTAAAGWHAYEAQVDARLSSMTPFFAHDRFGNTGWRAEVMRNEISMVKVDPPAIGDAKIHHWVGAVFVPRISLNQLIATLEANAGNESRDYDDVIQSRLIARRDDHLTVFMKLRRASIVTVTYNTEHQVDYVRPAATRATARSIATRIAELADAGTSNEREKSPDEDSGYLWKLNAYWRYEEVAGGVIVECESVSLSRSVPVLLRPVANPIVDRIARESLARTLESLRKALSARRG